MNQGHICDFRKQIIAKGSFFFLRIEIATVVTGDCSRTGKEGAGEQAASARGRSRGWPGKARLAGAQGGRLGRTIGRPAAGRRSSQRAAQQLRSSGGQRAAAAAS